MTTETTAAQQIAFLEAISGEGSEQQIVNPVLKWALDEGYATMKTRAGRSAGGRLTALVQITEAGLDALDTLLDVENESAVEAKQENATMSTEYEPSDSIERMWIDALELTPAFTDESMLNLIELAEPGIKILVVGDDPQHYDPLLDAGLIVKIGDENDWKQRYAITDAGRQYVAAHPFDVDAAVRRIAEAPVRPKVETLEAAREIIGELIDGIKAALALIDDNGKMSTYDVAVKYGVPVSQAVATLYETYLRTL